MTTKSQRTYQRQLLELNIEKQIMQMQITQYYAKYMNGSIQEEQFGMQNMS